ncbi:MAG: hypothetical protein Q6373_017020 [Candidatus Sigynarchaeota archaeon]
MLARGSMPGTSAFRPNHRAPRPSEEGDVLTKIIEGSEKLVLQYTRVYAQKKKGGEN